MSSLPDPIIYSRAAGDADDAWEIVTNPVTMQPGVETEFVCVGPSAVTTKPWDSTAEQELVRIREVYDTAGGAFFVADDANQFEDSAANIAASVNGVMGCWLDSSQSGTVQGRRNLLTYSEDLRTTAMAGETRPWMVATGGLVADNGDGWYRIYTDGSTGFPRVSELLTSSTGTFTIAADVKKFGSQDICYIGINGTGFPGGNGQFYRFTFSTKTLEHVQGAPAVASIVKEYSPTEFRIRVTATGSSTGAQFHAAWGITEATEGFLVRNAQLELGSEPTPYQKIITGVTDLVPGAHAFQNVTANKPYLRRTPTTGLNWADSNTATCALNVTFASALGSACTVARVGPDGVTFLEDQTIGTSYNIAPAYGWNGDVAIIDRPLTATEKALFTRFMLRHKPGLGAELVVNGTFDTDVSGWTNSLPLYQTAVSIDGKAVVERLAGAPSTPTLYRITNVATMQLVFKANITNVTAPASIVRLNPVGIPAWSGYTDISASAPNKTVVLPSGSTTPLVAMIVTGTGVVNFDNVSLKEIL